jgi:hypothetical protein
MPNTALALLDTVTEPAIAGGVISMRVTQPSTVRRRSPE